MIGGNHQRDILIAMTQAIRKEALRQIYEKIRPSAWHPDSLTEITESAGRGVTHDAEEREEAFLPTH